MPCRPCPAATGRGAPVRVDTRRDRRGAFEELRAGERDGALALPLRHGGAATRRGRETDRHADEGQPCPAGTRCAREQHSGAWDPSTGGTHQRARRRRSLLPDIYVRPLPAPMGPEPLLGMLQDEAFERGVVRARIAADRLVRGRRIRWNGSASSKRRTCVPSASRQVANGTTGAPVARAITAGLRNVPIGVPRNSTSTPSRPAAY